MSDESTPSTPAPVNPADTTTPASAPAFPSVPVETEPSPEPAASASTPSTPASPTPTPPAPAPPAPAVPPPPVAPPEQPYSTEVKADIAANRSFALLAYLSLLCLVVLALKSRSRFVAFHARQGLLIMVIQLLSLYTITWGGSGIWLVGITFGFSVIGILEVLRGNYWQFPYLGELSQKLTFF